MANGTDNNDDLTQTGDTVAEIAPPKTLPEMIEAIENDGSSALQENLPDQVLAIAMELHMLLRQEKLTEAYAQWALGTLEYDEKIQALKVLQNMPGVGDLRRAFYPTLEDMVREIRETETGQKSSKIWYINVIQAVNRLGIDKVQKPLTREFLDQVLETLPTRALKKGLIIRVQGMLEEKAFSELVGDVD